MSSNPPLVDSEFETLFKLSNEEDVILEQISPVTDN